MSCKANSSSKSIKFQPMPMAALIANLKTLPAQTIRDSSDSSDESSSSDNLALCSRNVQRSKTVPSDKKSRVKIPLTENRSIVKSVLDTKIEKTPSQADSNKQFEFDNVSNKENSSVSRSYRFPRVNVLPTIEASATTSQQVTVETLQSAQKRPAVSDKKETVRCLFPEPAKEPTPPKEPPTPNEPATPRIPPTPNEPATPRIPSTPNEPATPKEPQTPREPPTHKELRSPKEPTTLKEPQTPMEAPSYRPVITAPAEIPSESSFSQLTQPRTPSVAATPSQPLGKNSSKIQFKTINIKGKKYMFIKKLGAGGSSEVYKVLEMSSSQEFAVKCVDLATDREMAQGYMNEVRVLRELQESDRVIKLYEYEYSRGSNMLRLVLEAGETDLAAFLRAHRAGAPPALVLHYWEEMLTAVGQIHVHGIVHADLKPANFLLVSGRLKLIDFGIASTLNGDATSVVRSCGKGTFSYISPEALGGDGSQPFKVSFYSDVWSLGCILYSLIYGHTPFAHLATVLKLATIKDPKHCIAYPPADNIPPKLVTALQACLRYDAHSRPRVADLLQIKYLEHPQHSLDILLNKLRPHITQQDLDVLKRRIPDTLVEKLKPHVTPDELVILRGRIPDSLLWKLKPLVTADELALLQSG